MDWQSLIMDNWHVKLVSIVLIVAAWIDGKELRVPNWITFPMVLTGLIYSTWVGGWAGLGGGLLGICLLYTSPSPRDQRGSRMPSSA